MVILVDARGGKLKLVLYAADPATQMDFGRYGQKPEVARAGLESAVELLVGLRASKDDVTHVVPLVAAGGTLAPFRALALMLIKMEPRRRPADGEASKERRARRALPSSVAARN